MQRTLFRIILYVIVLVLSIVTSWLFGAMLSYLTFGTNTGEIATLYQLFGLGIAYIFWITMLGGFLRTKMDFYLMVVLLLPALWWEMQLDASRIYFPIALGIIGFVI